MDDVKQEIGVPLETPPKENKAILQAIMEDSSCDVATQTVNDCRNNSVTLNTLPENEINLNTHKPISHRPSRKGKKSNFRLFIVPDDPKCDRFSQDSGLRLSFDEKHNRNNVQSVRFSVISSESEEENKNPEPLQYYVETPRRSRNTFKQSEHSWQERFTASSSSFENIIGDGTIDHQLKHSKNPSVLAWLRLKNFEDREKRKVKKRDKKELRRHAYEEAEKRQKRIEESEKRFEEWMCAKKKEARRAWKEKRARRRVDVAKTEDTIRMDNDAPPNYTVVPSFKGTQSWTGEEVSPDWASENVNGNNTAYDAAAWSGSNNVNRPETNVLECRRLMSEQNQLSEEPLNTHKQDVSINGNITENNGSYLVDFETGNGETNDKRPVTADSRLLSVKGRNSEISKRSTYAKWHEEGSNNKRPSTSAGRLTSKTDCMTTDKEVKGMTYEAWLTHKRKEHRSKRPSTAQASLGSSEVCKKSSKKSITFKSWIAQKRQVDKEKAKQKKREVVDEALTEVIIKMARKRVENSYKEKKQLDTGMPKWRAKNRVGSSSGEKDANISNTSPSKYAMIHLLGDEIHEPRSSGGEQVNKSDELLSSQASAVTGIRKSCENLKLN